LNEKANGSQLSPRAVRWTVVDWPRGGHSTWPLRQLRAPGSTFSAGRISILTHRKYAGCSLSRGPCRFRVQSPAQSNLAL